VTSESQSIAYALEIAIGVGVHPYNDLLAFEESAGGKRPSKNGSSSLLFGKVTTPGILMCKGEPRGTSLYRQVNSIFLQAKAGLKDSPLPPDSPSDPILTCKVTTSQVRHAVRYVFTCKVTT